MTPAQRDRFAAPVVLIYWLMLVGGLLVYSAMRSEDLTLFIPLWVGVIAGTALGQCFALRDFRLWVMAVTVLAVLYVALLYKFMMRVEAFDGLLLAFAPATLCGFWSLSDRASLAAFWFPSVIWMLSVLDRTNGKATPQGAGVVLLAGLAVLFIVFLRARESRRVGVWRTVAVTPLATAKPPTLLREPAERQFARVGWGLLVSLITFALTAWIAPLLWKIETFDAGKVRVASATGEGLPCCPTWEEYDRSRSRVKEYFDFGRGNDELDMPSPGLDCQVCTGESLGDGYASGTGDGEVVGYGDTIPYPGSSSGPIYVDPEPYRGTGSTTTTAPGTPGAGAPTWSDMPSSPARGLHAAPGPANPATGSTPSITTAPPVVTPPPTVTPPAPAAAPTPVPPPAAAPIAPEPTVTPDVPAPTVTPPAPAAATPTPAPAPSTARAPRPAPTESNPAILHWVIAIVAAALLFQLVGLALRPLRRLITLRHLRRPFWTETVDQQVSNSWQLALVGLRDAGWRSTSSESPRDFARRVGVDGVEQCASILERAQHGIGIDSEDLATMSASADVAYDSARAKLGSTARAVGWVRWPLT